MGEILTFSKNVFRNHLFYLLKKKNLKIIWKITLTTILAICSKTKAHTVFTLYFYECIKTFFIHHLISAVPNTIKTTFLTIQNSRAIPGLLLNFSGTLVPHTGNVLLVNPHATSGVLDLKTQIQTLSGYRAQSRRSTGGSGAVQVCASDNTVWLLHDIWVYQLFRLTFNTHQDTTWCSSDFPVLAVAHCVVRDWEIYGLNIHQALLWLYAKHTCEVLNPKKKKSNC